MALSATALPRALGLVGERELADRLHPAAVVAAAEFTDVVRLRWHEGTSEVGAIPSRH
jgi:hypothetical protein